ncbi:hypothetical protein BJY01DRAFT_202282 [Aspergillus pseudoustus]|uniref:Uncharacterized protein n=1 Tax=Aspergillus pseudoustus TaxID=1810923 RepID=A0ABR4L2V2_9EURO
MIKERTAGQMRGGEVFIYLLSLAMPCCLWFYLTCPHSLASSSLDCLLQSSPSDRCTAHAQLRMSAPSHLLLHPSLAVKPKRRSKWSTTWPKQLQAGRAVPTGVGGLATIQSSHAKASVPIASCLPICFLLSKEGPCSVMLKVKRCHAIFAFSRCRRIDRGGVAINLLHTVGVSDLRSLCWTHCIHSPLPTERTCAHDTIMQELRQRLGGLHLMIGWMLFSSLVLRASWRGNPDDVLHT